MANVLCSVCDKPIKRRPIHITKQKKFYCSMFCQKQDKTTGQFYPCKKCSKPVWRTKSTLNKNIFCSRSCSTSVNNKVYKSGRNNPNWIEESAANYRRRAIEKYGYNCAKGDKCLLKDSKLPPIAYDVDHIDGNRKNYSIDNLQVLCLLCHRIKTYNIRI